MGKPGVPASLDEDESGEHWSSSETLSGSKVPPLPDEDPMIGRVLDDRYRIVAALARGGMGAVYRAEQTQLGRQVAIKVVSPHTSAGEGGAEVFHKRFYREARACAQLKSPHTVVIHDYGRAADGTYFLAMELLEGQTLYELIAERGTLDGPTAVHVAEQVASSLAEAHEHGLVHRDLKPSNLFIARTATGHIVKVLDFGLVKRVETDDATITKAGTLMGSPKYMSPEQVIGLHVDARSDLYSLGAVLYRLLTGRAPFESHSDFEVMAAHVHQPLESVREVAPDAGISRTLEKLVAKCLAKDKDDRYQSMVEVLEGLRACPEHTHDGVLRLDASPSSGSDRPVEEPPPTPAAPAERPDSRAGSRQLPRPASPTRTGRGPVRALASGMLIVAVAVLAAWLWPDPVPEAQMAPAPSTSTGDDTATESEPATSRELPEPPEATEILVEPDVPRPEPPSAEEPVATDRRSVQPWHRRARGPETTMSVGRTHPGATKNVDVEGVESAETPAVPMSRQGLTDNRDPWAEDRP